MILPYGLGEALRVLVGAPLLLLLPGFLLLLWLAPAWGLLTRAAVGAAVTAAALTLLAWALHAWAGAPLTPATAWLAYLGLLAACATVALLARRAWWPLRFERPRWTHAALAGAVLLAWTLALAPRTGYFLPLHVDEWYHLTISQAMVDQGAVNVTEPRIGVFRITQDGAVAYHLLWALLQMLTGASWLAIGYYGPLVVGALLVLVAWAAGEREGYGAEAALLVAVLPTSVRLLGPGFLVPLALGLFFIPAAFLLFTSAKPSRSLPLLALLVVFLFYAHPQSAAAAGILIGTYALLIAPKGWAKAATLAIIAATPFVLGVLTFHERVDPERLLEASSRLSVPEFLAHFGYVPAILFLAGTYAAILRPSAERLAWIVTSAAHLALVTLFVVFGIGQSNLYDRAWVHGMLTMAFTAAYALFLLRTKVASRLKVRVPTGVVAALVALALVATAVPAQAERNDDYYHVISHAEAEDFAWIRENVADKEKHRALVEPWKGTAFHLLTGVKVYAAYPFYIGSPVYNGTAAGLNNAGAAQRLLNQDVADERFLARYNITLVHTHGDVLSKNFTRAHGDVWMRTPAD